MVEKSRSWPKAKRKGRSDSGSCFDHWWAQWDITLEHEDGIIEEIFDFDNPTLPLTHEAMGEEFIAHKPLAYRHEVSNNMFNVRLVIISLKPFSISDGLLKWLD